MVSVLHSWRRLSILCSHLRPLRASDLGHAPTHLISSRGSNLDSEKENNKKNLHQNDCVFCKIIVNESQAVMLYEDDMCLCILDGNPLSHGHSLVIPKSQFLFIGSHSTIYSFNLVVNNGASAGQVIFHTHSYNPSKGA